MNSSEQKAIASIALLYLVRMLGLFMILPIMSIYMDKVEGATPFLIGVALGVYGLSQAMLQIPFGLLSDRVGRRPVILFGLAIFVLGSLVAAEATSILGIIAGRTLQGAGAIASTMMALLSDLTRLENRTKATAIVGMTIGSSFALALVIGPIVAMQFELRGVFLLTALLGLGGMVVLLVAVPRARVGTFNRDASLVASEVRTVLSDSRLLRIDVSIFLLHFQLMASFIAFPLALVRTGVVETGHWLPYLIFLLVSFACVAPTIGHADRHSRRAILYALVGLALSYGLLSQGIGSIVATAGGMIVFFASFNLLEFLLPSLLSKLAPAGTRGTAMGAYSTMQFAGAFVGGVVGGWVFQTGSLADIFYLNIATTVGWWFTMLRLETPNAAATRTLSVGEVDAATANRMREALSSVPGVDEVVVIEGEGLVYLKVDENTFDDALAAAAVPAMTRPGDH